MVQAGPNLENLSLSVEGPSAATTAVEEIAWEAVGDEWESDEPEMESDDHRLQMELLVRALLWFWRDRNDFYVSGNTSVYYDWDQRTNRNFKGPDFYVVLGAEKRNRTSWIVWQEGGRYPNVVVELLSNSTAKVDRTTKKALYQDIWRVPNYFWFHPQTLEFKGFELRDGQYTEIPANTAGHLWSSQLELFLGIQDRKLRFFTASGELVLLEEEEQTLRAERLAEKLRQLGVDPEAL